MNRPVPPRPARSMELSDLDSFDRKILNALVDDGRMSWRDLSECIGLSLTPAVRRVRKLEAEGFIEGYTAMLDERLLGSLSIFVSLSLDKQSEATLTRFETEIRMLPEIVSCFMMTGDNDYLLRIVVHTLDHYQRVLAKLTAIPHIAHIKSSVALRTVVQRRGLRM